MPGVGRTLADLLERYSRICGFSVIVQGGSCVLPSPKHRSPGIVAESHSDYIGLYRLPGRQHPSRN